MPTSLLNIGVETETGHWYFYLWNSLGYKFGVCVLIFERKLHPYLPWQMIGVEVKQSCGQPRDCCHSGVINSSHWSMTNLWSAWCTVIWEPTGHSCYPVMGYYNRKIMKTSQPWNWLLFGSSWPFQLQLLSVPMARQYQTQMTSSTVNPVKLRRSYITSKKKRERKNVKING